MAVVVRWRILQMMAMVERWRISQMMAMVVRWRILQTRWWEDDDAVDDVADDALDACVGPGRVRPL